MINRSEFIIWCIQHFGGKGNACDARTYAEKIVVEKLGAETAPIKLGPLGRALGLKNPRPVYKKVRGDGCIEIIDNEVRVVISSNSTKPPPTNHPLYRRMRFTYAHELGHLLFWDLNIDPPVRKAPDDNRRKEEEICNGLANGFLMPTPLLMKILDASGFDLHHYRAYLNASNELQVSFQALLYGVEDVVNDKIEQDEFIIISRNSRNRGEREEVKPRCIQCFVHNRSKKYGKAFFASYQGLDNAKLQSDTRKEWSLLGYFHKNIQEKQSLYVPEEVIRLPDNRIVELRNVRHEKVKPTDYVWTTGSFKILDK